MDVQAALPLLGGISPAQFMAEYWQKKPLLIRQAVPDLQALVSPAALVAYSAQEEVESRLLQQSGNAWDLQHGPLAAWPPLAQGQWTVLLQGMEVHHPSFRTLLDRFRFVPDARLDDLMVSYAAKGGGVGPHFDSYDVFLLQAAGRRQWQISAQQDLRLKPDLPLKILQHFAPEETFVLEPGDMLYLPPDYAHDGVALDDGCQTYSIGFYAPQQNELAATLLHRMAEIAVDEIESQALYRDPEQVATAQPGAIPAALQAFAAEGLAALLQQPHVFDEMLGEFLSEPKPTVQFAAGDWQEDWAHYRLHAATRMMYDERTVYCNGESWHASGADGRFLRALADARVCRRADWQRASAAVQDLLADWVAQGWAELEGGA